MKITTYPKQHITEIGDILYGVPEPEAVLIDEDQLGDEIISRIDHPRTCPQTGRDVVELETGDEDVYICVEAYVRWDEVEPPDREVGFYGRSRPYLELLNVQAWINDCSKKIEAKYDPDKLIDYVWRKY